MSTRLFFYIILFSSLNSCWFLPKEVVRSIYFEVPDRSDDLDVEKEPKLITINPQNSALNLEDEESPLEFKSREYFSGGFELNKNKPNVIDNYKDGRVLVGYTDGSVYELYLSDDTIVSALSTRLIAKGTSQILALKVSPDKKYLAVSQFSVVTIVDLEDLRLVAQLHRVKGRILELAWSPDSSRLLLGRANGDIFSWNLEENINYTLDTLDVLEMYETQASPVVDIIYHPSGRAFFVALENGSLFLIRSVQTELDLGLREEGKEYEIDKGSYVQKFGSIEGGVSKLFLLEDKEELLAVSFSGSAIRFRVRGLKQLEKIDIGSEASTFASFVNNSASKINSELIASIGRSLRLKLSCLNKDYNRLVEPTKDVFIPQSTEMDGGATTTASKLDDESLINELNQEIKKNEKSKELKPKGAGKEYNLVLETAKYLDSISILELNPDTGVLWVGGKSGIISTFYLRKYLQSSGNSSRIEAICKTN